MPERSKDRRSQHSFQNKGILDATKETLILEFFFSSLSSHHHLSFTAIWRTFEIYSVIAFLLSFLYAEKW